MFGADRVLLESVIAARERGFRCVVALPEHGPLVAELTAIGAEVEVTSSFVLRKELLHPRRWPRLVRTVGQGGIAAWRLISRRQPDCVYVNTVVLPLWPIVARMKRVPVISHVHEAEGSRSRLQNQILYAPLLASTRLLVNSRFTLDTVTRSVPALTRRSRLVHNGIPAPDLPLAPRAAPITSLRALYVGRLSPRKGPDVLIDASSTLAVRGVDVEVELLGSSFRGYEWFDAQLRARAASAGLRHPVVFHGFHENIWPFLAAADVLVVPSRIDESFGNAAVESVLALRPVIASDLRGLREAVGEYATATLVPAGDAAALADALAALAHDWPRATHGVRDSADRALARHATVGYRRRIGQQLAEIAAPRGMARSSTARRGNRTAASR